MPNDRAAGALPAPVAWADWISWRGPPELVVQIARRAIWAVGSTDHERQAATCTVEVLVRGDVEPISSPDRLLDEVTSDALRKFSMIAIDVRGARGRVLIEMTRKPMKDRGPLRRGVLLTAVSEVGAANDLRETVARAIERRASRGMRRYGELQEVEDVRAAAAEARK